MSFGNTDEDFMDAYEEMAQSMDDVSLSVDNVISGSKTSNSSSEINEKPIFEADTRVEDVDVDKLQSLSYKLENADNNDICEEYVVSTDDSVNYRTETDFQSLQSVETESRDVMDREHIGTNFKSLPNFKHNEDDKTLELAVDSSVRDIKKNVDESKTSKCNAHNETDTMLEDNDKCIGIKVEHTTLAFEPEHQATALIDGSSQQTEKLDVGDEDVNAVHETFDVDISPMKANSSSFVNKKQTKKYEGLKLEEKGQVWCLCYNKIVTMLPKPLNSDEGIALEVLEESAFLVTSYGSLFEVKLEKDSIQIVPLDQATILQQDATDKNEEHVSLSDATTDKDVKHKSSDVPATSIDTATDSKITPDVFETTISVTSRHLKRYDGLTLEKTNSQCSLCYKEIHKKLNAPFIGDEGLALEVLEDSAFLVTSDGCLFEVKIDNETITVQSLDQAVVLPQDNTNDKEDQQPTQESTDDKAIKSQVHSVFHRTTDENIALQKSENERPASKNDGDIDATNEEPQLGTKNKPTKESDEKDVKNNEKSKTEEKIKAVIDNECAEVELKKHLRTKPTYNDNVEENNSLAKDQSEVQEDDANIASIKHEPRSLVHDDMAYNVKEHQLTTANNKTELTKSIARQENQQQRVVIDKISPEMTKPSVHYASTSIHEDNITQMETDLPGPTLDNINKECDFTGKCTGRTKPNPKNDQVQIHFQQRNNTDLNASVSKQHKNIGYDANISDANTNSVVKPTRTVIPSPETRKKLSKSNDEPNQIHGERFQTQHTTYSANRDVSGDNLEQAHQVSDQTPSYFVEFMVTYPAANRAVPQRMTRECTLEKYMKWKYAMNSDYVQQQIGRCMTSACSLKITVEKGQLCFEKTVSVNIMSQAIDIFMEQLDLLDIHVHIISVENEPDIYVQKMMTSAFAMSKHLYAENLGGKVGAVYETANKPGIEHFLRDVFQGNTLNFDFALKRCTAVEPKVTKGIMKLPHFWAPLSCKVGLVKCLEKEFPTMNIIAAESASPFKITFMGTERQIESANVFFDTEFCKKLITKPLAIRIEQADVFKTTNIVQMAQKHIEYYKCIVILQHTPRTELVVYGFVHDEVRKAALKLSNFVTEQKYILTGHCRNMEVIYPIIQAIQHRYEGVLLTLDKDGATVYATGYKDNVNRALKDMKIQVDEKTVADAPTVAKQVVVRQRDAYSILLNDTNFQCNMKKRYNVHMSILKSQDQLCFVLTGKMTQVLECEEEVRKYVDSVVTERIELTDDHEPKSLKHKPILNNAQLEYRKKLVIENTPIQKIETYQTTEDRKTWLFPNGQKIVLCRNGVSESEADIIVSHIDAAQDPGILLTRAAQSSVIYEVLIPLFTNGQSGEEISAMKAIRHILETATKDQETTVAFPLEAVRSWNMSILTKCMVKCIGKFFLKQASSMKPRFAFLCSDDAELYKLYFDWCKSAIQDLETEISDELALNKQQPVQVEVVIGSLNNIQADVIVNTTAVNLDLKTGAVSSAILKSAGQGLQNECKTNYPFGIKHGQIAVTGGHNLKCKHVFHGSIPGFNKNNPASSMQHVRNFVNNCLYEANELKLASIAFPAIGAGNLNYPVDIVAEEMFNEVLRFQQQTMSGISLEEVKFVIYHQDKNAIQEFEKRETTLNQIGPVVGVDTEGEKRSMTARATGKKENVQADKRPIQETLSKEHDWSGDPLLIKRNKDDIEGNAMKDPIKDLNSSKAPTIPHRTYADAAARPKTTPAVTTQPSSVFICYTAKGITVRVYKGDILNLAVGCIVNPANKDLNHSSGLAKVIADRAGSEIVKESNATRYLNKIHVGNAVATTAGNLRYKCVVHAVGPAWNRYKPHTLESVQRCRDDLKNTILQCLLIAEQRKMKSIAFPPVGSGRFGVPKEMCATAYADALFEFENAIGFGNRELREVHFVDIDISMVGVIKQTLKVMIQDRKPCPHSFLVYISTIPTTMAENDRFEKDSVSRRKDNVASRPVQQHGKQFPTYREQDGRLTCEFSYNHTIHIYNGDIFAIHDVKAIACGEDAIGNAQGYVASKLKKLGQYSYEQVKKAAFSSSKPIKVGDVIISSGGLNTFEWIFHAIVPLRLQFSSDSEWKTPYRKMFDRIFGEAARKGLSSIVLTLLGTGRGSSDVRRCAEIFLDSYTVACNRHSDKHLTIHMVNNETPKTDCLTKLFKEHINKTKAYQVADTKPTPDLRVSIKHTDSGAGRSVSYTSTPKGDKSHQGDAKSPKQGASYYSPPLTRSKSQTEQCPICLSGIKNLKKLTCNHTFCTDCIEQHFKTKKVCPTCGHICGKIIGDQPPGDMVITKTIDRLSGFQQQSMTLSITYTFKDGKQQGNHPKPGSRYNGFKRIAYLPDNKEGREICAMLSEAFKRKLVFTIGRSNTTGGDGVITWNDIHHKTSTKPYSSYGYPDIGYLDRVRGELKSKGITAADVDKGFLGKLKILQIYGTINV